MEKPKLSKYTADFKVLLTVEFFDDGEHALPDLAFEAVEALLPIHFTGDVYLYSSSVKPI